MSVNLVIKLLGEEKQLQVQLGSEALFLVTPAGNKSGSLFLPAPNPALFQADRGSPSARAVPLPCCCSFSLVQQGIALSKPNRVLQCPHLVSPWHFPISNKSRYSRDISGVTDSTVTCLEGWNPLTTPNQGFLLHTNSATAQGYEAKRIDSLHPVTHRTQPRKSSDPSHCTFIKKWCNLSQPIYLYKSGAATITSFPNSAV